MALLLPGQPTKQQYLRSIASENSFLPLFYFSPQRSQKIPRKTFECFQTHTVSCQAVSAPIDSAFLGSIDSMSFWAVENVWQCIALQSQRRALEPCALSHANYFSMAWWFCSYMHIWERDVRKWSASWDIRRKCRCQKCSCIKIYIKDSPRILRIYSARERKLSSAF